MMKKFTATIGVSVALGVAGIVAAPSASAHWADRVVSNVVYYR